jgi:peptidoglycan/LPS O-acetylase OafA/YrhL
MSVETVPASARADSQPERPARSRRIPSLDGLRGVAALTVMMFHIALSDGTIGQRAYRTDQVTGISWSGYLMTFTPLHVLWAGSQAVLVFYVLSGFVLTLPFVNRTASQLRGQWTLFYRSRAVRLYAPAIASLILAWMTTLAVKRSFMPDLPPWPNEHMGGLGLRNVVLGSSLMGGFGGLNGSLWSLRWEVLFSLLLPVFLLLGAWRVQSSRLKAVVLFALLAAWPIATGTLYLHATYILVFGFGVLMAFNRERLGVLAQRISSPGWWALLVLGCVLLTLQWLVLPFGVGPSSLFTQMWMSYGALGAAVIVFCAGFWPAAQRFLVSKPLHALGVLSFSLYLVQEPVILNITLLTHSKLPLWAAIPLEVGAAIVVAVVFYRVVERPAHYVARALGKGRPSAEPNPALAAAPSPRPLPSEVSSLPVGLPAVAGAEAVAWDSELGTSTSIWR